MGVFKLDVKDEKIVNVLFKNCRVSFSKVSKVVGVSKEVINYRFKRFVDFGFIKKCFCWLFSFN